MSVSYASSAEPEPSTVHVDGAHALEGVDERRLADVRVADDADGDGVTELVGEVSAAASGEAQAASKCRW